MEGPEQGNFCFSKQPQHRTSPFLGRKPRPSITSFLWTHKT